MNQKLIQFGGIIILFFTINYHAYSQNFEVSFGHSNCVSYHSQVCLLSDSTYCSITRTNYLSKVTLLYDSTEILLVRFNKRGEELYNRKFIPPKGLIIDPHDIVSINNDLYLGGLIYETSSDDIFGFMMKMSSCFDVERFSVYRHKKENSNYIDKLFQYSDSEILVIGRSFVQSDTLFCSALLMGLDFKIKWHTSFMCSRSDVCISNQMIHLWGYGYFPRNSDPNIVELKRNYVIINNQGKVIFQNVDHEHTDFYYSQGGKMISSSTGSFQIGMNATKPDGTPYNSIEKYRGLGKSIKSIQLNNDSVEEYGSGICRLNDNAFLVKALIDKDIDNKICNIYLVDSNLNVIRKKRILSNYPLVEIQNQIAFENSALLYGRVRKNLPGELQKGILYMIDTFLNVKTLPSNANFNDSLCLNYNSGSIISFPNPDTIWLESLDLRQNLSYLRVGIQQVPSLNVTISVYPNPTAGLLYLKSIDNGYIQNIKVFNTNGMLVKEFNSDNKIGIEKIQLNDLYSGLYILVVQTEFGVQKVNIFIER